jgi:Cytochrome c7 and related cytochrome c
MAKKMGGRTHRLLDFALLLALAIAAAFGMAGAACGGLTSGKGDHVEVGNKQCVVCHRDEYLATTKPPHPGLFPETCADCHTQREWSPAKFTHPFPLVGKHAEIGCVGCHGDPPNYNLPKTCVGCHKADYDSSPYPGHQTFPTTCDDCHNTLAWKPASDTKHPWPLTGAHAVTPCISCHVNAPVYSGTPTECVGCHQQDYDSSPWPGHQQFPTTCADCHSTFKFKPATEFKHPWPLLGAHQKPDCFACHGNPPKYTGMSTECYACHQKDYESSPYPGHQGFPHTCQDCHGINAWVPASTFTHPFPLDGAHGATPCESCHVGNPPVYKGTPSDCWSCHQADYQASPYPGHQGFQHTCLDCHTTAAWKPASGTGHPENIFPIKSGKHTGINCNDCHNQSISTTNSKATADCVGCHTGQHTLSKMNSVHKDVSKYPTGTGGNFCLDCHPNGKRGN